MKEFFISLNIALLLEIEVIFKYKKEIIKELVFIYKEVIMEEFENNIDFNYIIKENNINLTKKYIIELLIMQLNEIIPNLEKEKVELNDEIKKQLKDVFRLKIRRSVNGLKFLFEKMKVSRRW